MSLKPLLILCLALIAAGQSDNTWAWGPRGHELVAEIASRELRPDVKKEVERLLGDRADLAMREAATWADEARNEPAFRNTGNWHYVNFPRGQCQIDRATQCRDGNCVYGALEAQGKRLQNRKLKLAERAEALRFVIHFVGDAHQPLHAGWKDDRGGNDKQVRAGRREGGNLHGFWDGDLIRRDNTRVREHADQILTPMPKLDRTWDANAATDWALESCQIVKHPDFYFKGVDLPADYVSTFRPVAERRLVEAGYRLGSLLNQVLSF